MNPKEIPYQPEKPTTIPPVEPTEPIWPQTDPEIQPEAEPSPQPTPTEIPAPPKEQEFLKYNLNKKYLHVVQ